MAEQSRAEQSEERIRPSAAVESYRRPRRGWQRRTKQSRETLRPRDTLRDEGSLRDETTLPGESIIDVRSPAEEVLARHDAELQARLRGEQLGSDSGESGESTVITF